MIEIGGCASEGAREARERTDGAFLSAARRAAPTSEVLTTSASWSAEGDQADAAFGGGVKSAGDVDGDGFDDVLVGASDYADGETEEGAAFLYPGSTSGPATSPAWTADGDQAWGGFAGALASAGDVNGDGYADVIVGAGMYTVTAAYDGRAWVYLGSPAGLETTAAWVADGDQERGIFGSSVGSAGDVNGDGFDDVVVGAYAYDHPESDEGRVYVYLGSAAGLSTSAAWTADSNQPSSDFGGAVAGAGDVDGDGYGDLIVGSPEYDHPTIREGRAWLFLGTAGGLESSAAWTAETDHYSWEMGGDVASAGDVDGDGYDDVIVGALSGEDGESGEGLAYVFLGSSTGLGRTAAWTAGGDEENGHFGNSVAPAGDVDLDGYDDVVVGAHHRGRGGAAMLYLGSAAGLDPSPVWTMEADQDDARFGASVASAGDVDGDGYGDLIIGAVDYSNGERHEGRAQVYLGGDLDGDGYTGAEDCDDEDPSNHPSGTEVCDGADNNCDGVVDDGAADAERWYPDGDADGYGTGEVLSSCEAPEGYGANDLDCDDGDADVHPGVAERCNGVDDDCDGTVDEAAVDPGTWYADVDGDGFGTPTDTTEACGAPAGYVAAATDCADADPAIHPTAEERCDGIDTNCDGSADGDAVDASTWYADVDADGHGDPLASTLACTAPPRYVGSADDCDDTSALTSPDVSETCNGWDDDCDELVDEADAIDVASWYRDLDGDGYGDGEVSTPACASPVGYVENPDDCSDVSESIHPDAEETCNGLDDDCDGVVDEDASTPGSWYLDGDGDGFGDSTTLVEACTQPEGAVDNALDCDDGDASTYPGAVELAYDSTDQDCDGADWTDVDGDGFDATFVGGDDCDDGDPGVSPGSVEAADGVDQDCDGVLDNSTTWGDDDADGVTEVGGDCDDDDPGASPGATELADGRDNNCDGVVDERTAASDDDGDGYTEADGDCVDDDVSIHPGAVELDDGVDNDCDGVVDDGDIDDDGDGYGDDVDCAADDAGTNPGAPEVANGRDDNCDGRIDEGTTDSDDDADGASETEGDCDDSDPSVGVGALEQPNGRDDDCDGTIDEGTEGYDDDGDGLSELAGDCDDSNAAVRPGGVEIPDNGIDDNCDGDIAEGGVDADGDGYTVADGDCDDQDGWARPGLAEQCDGRDNNCDGNADEGACERTEAAADTGRATPRGCACDASAGPAGVGGLGMVLALARRRRARPQPGTPGQPTQAGSTFANLDASRLKFRLPGGMRPREDREPG